MRGVLRRMTRGQVIAHLESIHAAPFHIVLWNGTPLRLEQAHERAQAADGDAYFYVRGEHVLGPLAGRGVE